MEQQIFEGTWEEILNHAPELAGRRVRLTVLRNEVEQATTENLGTLLQDRVGKVSFQPANLSERTGEAFADFLQDKQDSRLSP